MYLFSRENGDLEELPPTPNTPRIMSSNIFRETLLEEWKDRLKEIENFKLKETESVNSEEKSLSRVSSNYKFVGDFNDPYQVIRKAPDFDSIILLLHEVSLIAGDQLRLYLKFSKFPSRTSLAPSSISPYSMSFSFHFISPN